MLRSGRKIGTSSLTANCMLKRQNSKQHLSCRRQLASIPSSLINSGVGTQDQISGGGGWKLLETLQANTFRNIITCISFIIQITQRKYRLFKTVFLRKIENWKIFRTKIIGGRLVRDLGALERFTRPPS